MAITVFTKATGVEFNMLNFNSGGEALTQLLGGHVQACMGNPLEFMGHLQSKAVKALGVFRDDRFTALPDVPTMKEQGINAPNFQMWRGMATPRGTPDDAAKYWEGGRLRQGGRFADVQGLHQGEHRLGGADRRQGLRGLPGEPGEVLPRTPRQAGLLSHAPARCTRRDRPRRRLHGGRLVLGLSRLAHDIVGRLRAWQRLPAADLRDPPLGLAAAALLLESTSASGAASDDPAAESQPIRTPFIVLLALAAGVAGIEPAGFFAAMFLTMLFLFRIVEKSSLVSSVIASAATSAVLTLVFRTWLGVPLPKGPWGF